MNRIHKIKKNISGLVLTAVIGVAPVLCQGQVITTLAGGELLGKTGDGGYSINALLSDPGGIAVDKKGNIYIGDRGNNRIRKINSHGVITTAAGFGSAGMSGDGGPAEEAKVSYPCGMAIDSAGDFYFADTYNNRVRKIDANGVISTVAGNGANGYNGDTILATDARLNAPRGVAFDANNNLYIADFRNNRVRLVTPDGMIYTIAGSGDSTKPYYGEDVHAKEASLYHPTDVAILADGSLVIADAGNSILRKVNMSDTTISTYAGVPTQAGFGGDDGPATNAKMSYPVSLAADRDGNLFFADIHTNRVRMVGADGNINTVVGDGRPPGAFNGDGGLAVDAQLLRPSSVAVDTSGNLYVGDASHRVRYVYLDEPQETEEINAFPNPCNKNTNIFLHSIYAETANIFVLDASGRQVNTFVAPTNMFINVHFDASGLYIIHAVSAHGSWQGKVIVMQ